MSYIDKVQVDDTLYDIRSEVDKTLTNDNVPADAKITGELYSNVKTASLESSGNVWIPCNFVVGRVYKIKNTSSSNTAMSMHTTNGNNYTYVETITSTAIEKNEYLYFSPTVTATTWHIYANGAGNAELTEVVTIKQTHESLNDLSDNVDLALAFNAEKAEALLSIEWEQGNLNGTTGLPFFSHNAIRDAGFISPGTYRARPNGQKVYIYKFLTDGTRDGQLNWGETNNFTFTVPSGNKVRLVIMKTNGANIVPDECTVTVSRIGQLTNTIYRPIELDFLSICHQGYSSTASMGNSLLGGYKVASEHGFNYAETDVKLTSDNVLVCCHDASFVDATTGTTIVIAEHTVAELKTYNYYGGTIATLDEILNSCKTNRIGLAIDQIVPDLLPYVFTSVKKHGMQRSVAYLLGWSTGYPEYTNGMIDTIVAFDKHAKIMVLCNSADYVAEITTFLNSVEADDARLYICVAYNVQSASQVVTLTSNLNGNVSVAVYTIDDLATAQAYYPHITALISNKLSLRDILF